MKGVFLFLVSESFSDSYAPKIPGGQKDVDKHLDCIQKSGHDGKSWWLWRFTQRLIILIKIWIHVPNERHAPDQEQSVLKSIIEKRTMINLVSRILLLLFSPLTHVKCLSLFRFMLLLFQSRYLLTILS